MSGTESRQLFGGAITATLPTGLIDASDLRQVPDTQEVLLYPDSGISIILEVLQCVDVTKYTDIARCHFDSLAHDNDAESKSVDEISRMYNEHGPKTPGPIVLKGSQMVRKFNSKIPDEIRILMAVYRLQQQNIDLVLSMNVPMKASDGIAVDEAEWNSAAVTFNAAVSSLQIVDFGLFA
ncbi:uncharacterized protein FIBRA_05005 [Fibroporia radiculosa]|uniref:Mog1p/PsbP-like protein n=1 Tax=Fibroporia radiculosa TaxID=599839 RepID=J4IAG9_9APHY|nr:uncharacterized protein FIBRA_05005 [Fibroporia radiculosa]CCM02891.1 predicted protein [Fibroporia radiculosa]